MSLSEIRALLNDKTIKLTPEERDQLITAYYIGFTSAKRTYNVTFKSLEVSPIESYDKSSILKNVLSHGAYPLGGDPD